MKKSKKNNTSKHSAQLKSIQNSERNRCVPKALTFLGFDDPLRVSLACTALCLSAVTAEVLWVL